MAEPLPAIPPKTWPKIRLQMPSSPPTNVAIQQRPPSTAGSVHSNPLYVPMYGNFNNMQPMTPITAGPQNNPYYNPFTNPGKASEFMFRQFEGFKDFTMNTAKSGLSVGEKSAFWMYNKVSSWSRKWFTHIFLFLVIIMYTVAGAVMFTAVEGAEENSVNIDYTKEKNDYITEFRKIVEQKITLLETPDEWEGQVLEWANRFEIKTEEWISRKALGNKKVWTFWNAMFYCGTIYTTVGL